MRQKGSAQCICASTLTYTLGVIRFLKRFVVLLLLAWLPVQAAALPALAMLCDEEGTASHDEHAFAVGHGHHNGISPHSHAAGDDEVGGATHDHGNGCCHHLYSAALPVSLEAPRESGSHFDLTPLFSLFSFFPEQPQRPPLT